MPKTLKRSFRPADRTPEFCKRVEELYIETGDMSEVARQIKAPYKQVRAAIKNGPFVPLLIRRRQKLQQENRVENGINRTSKQVTKKGK